MITSIYKNEDFFFPLILAAARQGVYLSSVGYFLPEKLAHWFKYRKEGIGQRLWKENEKIA